MELQETGVYLEELEEEPQLEELPPVPDHMPKAKTALEIQLKAVATKWSLYRVSTG